jgi:hypothetical protein
MVKKEHHIEDYINDISPDYADFILALHQQLTEAGCLLELKQAANGHVVSYRKDKRIAANFVSRKKGPLIRIYGENVGKYAAFIETLPDNMMKAIAKTPACKRLLNSAECSSRCPMGYDFTVKDERYQKCRYNCFLFEINADNLPHIKGLLENELRERAA